MQKLAEDEEKVVSFWLDSDVQKKSVAKNAKGKKFYFLDGPPYTTGDLHPGQMWVKSVKDLYLRYKRLSGFNVVGKAGYDVHGLPIENQVEKEYGIKSKNDIEENIGIENFVIKCREFVDRYKGSMDRDYYRFGISLDFSKPYLPYTSDYIENSWGIFKRIHEKGYVYNDTKTVIFCPHCETPISQGSLETVYKEVEGPSIVIRFKIDEKSEKKLGLKNGYLLVWTTTPWTIPGNVAVALNPDEDYIVFSVNGEDYIAAKRRIEFLKEVFGEVLQKSEMKGAELRGILYISPIESDIPLQKELRPKHTVLLSSEMVSMEEGTGIVHMAPAHGIEDYNLCRQYKTPVPNLVGTNARYNKDAGRFEGLEVPREANQKVIEALELAGALLYSGKIRHSYPHCWRCNNELIFIQTKQWFFDIQKIKKKILRLNDKVAWHPSEAKAWENAVLENSPDWCISRQRYWGIPIPIWLCKDCGDTFVAGSLDEIKERALPGGGIKDIRDLHRPHIDTVRLRCKCGSEMKRIPDVFDVWFDSGSAFFSALTQKEFEQLFPVDYIVEGSDQLRGWFSAMIKIGCLAFGKIPFKHIAIDGMMLAADGREMHKSLRNYVPVRDILEEYSADSFRLWCIKHTPWLDLYFKTEELRLATKNIILLRNIGELVKQYSEIKGMPRKPRLPDEEIDRWILSKTESLVAYATERLNDYSAHDAIRAIEKFAVEDFSRFYLKNAKQRITSDGEAKRKGVVEVIRYVVYKLVIMASPFVPFTAELMYRDLFMENESVFLDDWPKSNRKYIDHKLEADFEVAESCITTILKERENVRVGLKTPIFAARVIIENHEHKAALLRLKDVVMAYANLKNLYVDNPEKARIELKPNYSVIGPKFKKEAGIVAELIKKADPSKVIESTKNNGKYDIDHGVSKFQITENDFVVVGASDGQSNGEFKYGRVVLEIRETEEIKNEEFLRILIKTVQTIRKEMNLKRTELIAIDYFAEGKNALLISKETDRMKRILGASKIKEIKESEITGDYVRALGIEYGNTKVRVSRIL